MADLTWKKRPATLPIAGVRGAHLHFPLPLDISTAISERESTQRRRKVERMLQWGCFATNL
jgi:hypothetical protein